MSLGRIVVSGLLLSLVPVLKIQACSGGGCLVSYFPGGDDSNHRRYFPKTAVATNAVVKSCNDYYLTLHLGTELAMIGAHYYPTWTGKAPSDNPLSTSKADELDFFTAGAFAAVPKKTVVEDWRRFTAFGRRVLEARIDRPTQRVNVPILHPAPQRHVAVLLRQCFHIADILKIRDDKGLPRLVCRDISGLVGTQPQPLCCGNGGNTGGRKADKSCAYHIQPIRVGGG